MAPERVREEFYTDTTTILEDEAEQFEHAALDHLQPQNYKVDEIPTSADKNLGSAEEAAQTRRGRLRYHLGRAAAALALTGAALIGSTAAPEEAEAATAQGPVTCRNYDGSSGLQLGQLCLVNAPQYSPMKGPNEQIINYVTSRAVGNKCETAFFAADASTGLAIGKALKVYKAGRFVQYTTPVGLLTMAGFAIVGNQICK